MDSLTLEAARERWHQFAFCGASSCEKGNFRTALAARQPGAGIAGIAGIACMLVGLLESEDEGDMPVVGYGP